MPKPHSPTARGRKLAAELRRLREKAGLTHEETAAQLGSGWSRYKVSRIEQTITKPTLTGVEAMLELYGVDTATRAALVELHKNAWRRGWWTDYRDVFQGSYIAMEDDADRIDSWNPQLVPGLLQTDEYAREVIRTWTRDDEAETQRRLMVRMTRRALLTRADPPAPKLTTVIDEAVLRRPIGGADVMRGQLHALVDAGHRSNVTVRVLPSSTGTHAGLDGPFIILGFPSDLSPDIAYVEIKAGDAYVEDIGEVNRFRMDYQSLLGAALSPEESADFIAAITRE